MCGPSGKLRPKRGEPLANFQQTCQSDSQSPTESESTQSQNIGNARTNFLYVHKMPIRSCLLDSHSIFYSNSRTRCKYVAVFIWPVNAVLIMLLITYFTTDRVLLSTFVLSVINNIITTPQDAIIDQESCGWIPISNDQPNYCNTRLQEHCRHSLEAQL